MFGSKWRPTLQLKPDPLDLILREPILGAVVKLGRARAFVCRHLLRVLERAAVAEISRDAGRAERMIADLRHDASGSGAAADHQVAQLPPLARALAVSVEDLIGEEPQSGKRGPAPKLLQQVERIQRLPKAQQRFVMQMIDTVLQQAAR